jgi:hypothetical protein
MNFIIVLAAALIPLIVGFIWYHPKVFGNAWMKAAEMTEEKIKGGNMAMTFILTYVLSVLAAFAISFMVVHQYHLYSLFQAIPNFGDPDSVSAGLYAELMERYGNHYRTVRHGLFHGALNGILVAMPVLAVNAMYERRSLKYVLINAGFWIVSFALMGGVLCEWL